MSFISARTKRIMSNLSKMNQNNFVPVLPEPVISNPLVTELVVPGVVLLGVSTTPVVTDPVLSDLVVPDPVIAEPIVPDPVIEPAVSNPVTLDSLVSEAAIQETVLAEPVLSYTLVPATGHLDNIMLWDENGLVFNLTEDNIIVNNEAIIENYLVSTEDGVLHKKLNHTDVNDDLKEYEIEECDVSEDFEEFKENQEVNQNNSIDDNNKKNPDYAPEKETTEDISNGEKHLYSETNQKKKLSVSQKRKLSQARRVRGKSYEGYKRSKENIVSNTPRNKRQLKTRCGHPAKEKLHKNSFLCFNISDDERKEIHSKFWKLATWSEKNTCN